MSLRKQRNRENISIRLQPTEGSPLAKIAKWLKTMSIEEKNKIVSELLVMNCLALAEAQEGAEQEEIERTYWECENSLYLYRFTLRKRLNIQGHFYYLTEPQRSLSKPIPQVQEEEEEEEEEVEVASLRSQLLGGGKVKNAGSIFNGFG